MTPSLVPPVPVNRGQDILHCYHAALAARRAAHTASAFGDDDLSQLYREQANWRVALAMRFSGYPRGTR